MPSAYQLATTPAARAKALQDSIYAQYPQYAGNARVNTDLNINQPLSKATVQPQPLTVLKGGVPGLPGMEDFIPSKSGFLDYQKMIGFDNADQDPGYWSRQSARIQQGYEKGSAADYLMNQIGVQQLRRGMLDQQERLARDKALAEQKISEQYEPNLADLKGFLSQRGLLNSSIGGENMAKLLKDTQTSIGDLQRSFNDQMKDLNKSYQASIFDIQRSAQSAALQAEQQKNQQLMALESDYRLSNEKKQAAKQDVMRDYMGYLRDLKSDYSEQLKAQQAQLDGAASAAQQEFENAIKMANLTGMYGDQPTLTMQKFLYDQQQDALALANKGRGGGGGGSGYRSSSSAGSSTITDWVDKTYALYESGEFDSFDDAAAAVAKGLPDTNSREAFWAEINKRRLGSIEAAKQEQATTQAAAAKGGMVGAKAPSTTPEPANWVDALEGVWWNIFGGGK